MLDEVQDCSLELLEQCLVDNDENAWREFLAVFRPLIQRVVRAHASPQDVDTIVDSFPGWLFLNRKLHYLYRRLDEEFGSANKDDVGQIAAFVTNYLGSIIQSAVSDWYRGLKNMPDRLVDDFAQAINVDPAADVEAMRSALLGMSADHRMPFWLRHYPIFGMPIQDDIDQLACIHGCDAAEIRERIETHSQDIGPSRSFSSRFIGQLLKFELSASGRDNCVDQRIHRVRLDLKRILTQ